MKHGPGQNQTSASELLTADLLTAGLTPPASGPRADSTDAGASLVLQARQRRLNEARAREHVGAAGWRQSTLLEELIRAGREQFASAETLRQVVTLTTQSLRSVRWRASSSRATSRSPWPTNSKR